MCSFRLRLPKTLAPKARGAAREPKTALVQGVQRLAGKLCIKLCGPATLSNPQGWRFSAGGFANNLQLIARVSPCHPAVVLCCNLRTVTQAVLAERFGMSPASVMSILGRRSWKHI
jgi:hypothetical protein